ncbi:MAG: nucleoside triphosphate pyrophosphohydrolase [Spirochaetales bacterium]
MSKERNPSEADGTTPQVSSALTVAFSAVYGTLITLRSPDGCPWDREQSPVSLRSNLIEEAYELIDAINGGSVEEIAEELGDVLLLVAMIARCYEEDAVFSFSDVMNALNEKLIRRHPHVFGDAVVTNSDDVIKQWNEIKTEIEGKPKKTRYLDSVSRSAPPLERAYRLQKRAAKVGFDWTTARDVLAKLREEIEEVEEVLDRMDKDTDQAAQSELEAEIGDLLFSAVNVSRYAGVDPALALDRTNATFYRRFAFVEDEMSRSGHEMTGAEIDRMEELWQRAKTQ